MRPWVAKAICAKEILDFSRDRRTLYLLVWFPLIYFGVLLFLMFKFGDQRGGLSRGMGSAFFAQVISSFLSFGVPTLAFGFSSQFGIDITAGEKERGTIETTLCLPASPMEQAWGKYFAISAAAFTGICLPALLIVVVWLIGIAAGVVPTIGVSASTFWRAALLFTVVSLNVGLLLPAAVLFIGLMAKSVKEANTTAGVIMLVILFLPTLTRAFGVNLHVGTSLVPLLNVSLLTQGLFTDTNIFLYAPLVLLSTGVCLWVALKLTTRLFLSNAMLSSS